MCSIYVFLGNTFRDQWIVSTMNEIKSKLDNLTSLLQTVVATNIPSLSLPNDVNLPVDNDENLQNLETKLLNQAFKDQIVSLALVMYKNLSISLGRQERLGREGSTLGRHGDAHVQDRGFLKIFLGDCPFQYTDTRKLKR